MQQRNDSESAREARNQKAVEPPKPHRLTAAWKKARVKLRRTLCTLTAAGALTFGFAGAASAQPAKPSATVAHHQPGKKPNYAYSQARVNAIEAKMRKTALGREMLEFAGDNGLTIRMSTSKVMDDKPNDGFTIAGNYGGTQIRLNGVEKSDDQVMLTLVHELRHAWHDFAIHAGDMRLDPTRSLVRDRLLEADVFAFEIHFAYEYEKATGIQLHLGDRARPCSVTNESSRCLLAGYAADRAGGMDTPAAYGKLLERTLKHVHAEEYDPDFLSAQNESWQSVIDDPSSGKALFGADLTSDADFAATMRRVATVGMTPGATPSALAGWTEADLTSLAKTSGTGKAEVKGLDGATKKFDAAREAWNLYQMSVPEQAPGSPSPATSPAPAARPMIHDGVRVPRPAAPGA